MPSRLLEIDLAKAATDLLALDGWRHLKTDPVSDKKRGKGFGEVGMADSLYIRYSYDEGLATKYGKDDPAARIWAQLLWIEWKTFTGTVAEHQRAWREQERARGALALIAGIDFHASIEGFARWYAQSGLQRQKMRIGGTMK